LTPEDPENGYHHTIVPYGERLENMSRHYRPMNGQVRKSRLEDFRDAGNCLVTLLAFSYENHFH